MKQTNSKLKVDIDDEVLVNVGRVDKKQKKHKFINIFMPTVGAAALIGGATALTISLIKKPTITDSEITKEHNIEIVQPTGEESVWTIQSTKTTAKKGDTVVFIVEQKQVNVSKLPSKLKINNAYYPLTLKDGKYSASVKIDFVETMKVEIVFEETPQPVQQHIVSFETFSQTQIDPQIIITGNKASEPSVKPIKLASNFQYWYSDDENNPFDFATPIIKNLTLKAKYTPYCSNDLKSINFLVDKATTLTFVLTSLENYSLYYSYDNKNWTPIKTIGLQKLEITPEKSLFLRGKGNNVTTFPISNLSIINNAKIFIDGSLMGLCLNDDETFRDTTLSFANLFSNFLNLIGVSKNLLKIKNSDNEIISPMLVEECYRNMFGGCTALKEAPALPATTLADYCYYEMFKGCTSLKIVENPENFDESTKIFTCPETIPNDAVTDMFAETSGTFIGTPTVAQTYYWTDKIISEDFTTCSWNYINQQCSLLENKSITKSNFCSRFKKSDGTEITQMSDFVGLERKITINNKEHIVRVIGKEHDTITGTNNKAALTFELVTVLSNSDGKAMTTMWNNSYTNDDYVNSTLRANLNGTGTGAKSFSSTVLSMLPSDLQLIIKTVNKNVATNPTKTKGIEYFEVTEYSDKLFPLTATEMSQSSGKYEAEGTPYKYWTDHDTPEARSKKDVNGNDSNYWLTSPYIDANCDRSCYMKFGEVGEMHTNDTETVSFAFCI